MRPVELNRTNYRQPWDKLYNEKDSKNIKFKNVPFDKCH